MIAEGLHAAGGGVLGCHIRASSASLQTQSAFIRHVLSKCLVESVATGSKQLLNSFQIFVPI